jgi:hypothetical protein
MLSFDIGIKNMAYCFFDLSNNGNPAIKAWGILNLMDEEDPIPKCRCVLKPKSKKSTVSKTCDKVAKYAKNGAYYCLKHAILEPWIIPTKEISTASLRKLDKEKLGELGIKYKRFQDSSAVPASTTVAVPASKKALLEALHAFFLEHCFEPIVKTKSKTASTTDLITLGRNMRDRLDELPWIQEVTHIIMENQISPLAGRMKTVQGMLAQYFIMRSPNAYIEFVSSANKLKGFKLPSDNTATSTEKTVLENPAILENAEISQKTDKDKYKKHKTDSVAICSQLLEQTPGFVSWKHCLETPKKDDLADCFLQGIWWIKKCHV